MEEFIGVIAGSSGDSITDKLHEKGYKVALVVGRNEEPGTDCADEFYIVDLKDVDGVIHFFRRCQVKNVLIGTGHKLAFELAKILETKGFRLSIDIEKSLLAKDKIAFKKSLIKQGILTPEYYVADVEEDFDLEAIKTKIGIPCVVKSATDAIQPQKANTEGELRMAAQEVFATKTVLLVEKYIKGGDCTVAISNDGNHLLEWGVILYSKAKEYALKGFGGSAKTAVLSSEQKEHILKIAKKVVSENGLLGLVRVDFIVDNNIYVLEANSVMVTGYNGSAYPFFKKAGFDIAEIMVENAIRIFDYKIGG